MKVQLFVGSQLISGRVFNLSGILTERYAEAGMLLQRCQTLKPQRNQYFQILLMEGLFQLIPLFLYN
jgi:hypothetical protein